MKIANLLITGTVWLSRLATGLAFAVLMAAVLYQVVGRMTGNSAVWTEELTRYALLYMIAFGAGLALRSGDLVSVDVISAALPGRLPWILRLFAGCATLALSLYLLPHAWKFVSIGRMQTSPALGMQMTYAHLTVWLTLAGLALFAALRVIAMISGSEDGKPQTFDET